jgi:hypothetical protein
VDEACAFESENHLVDGRRCDAEATLVAAWEKQRNGARARVTWSCTIEKAREKWDAPILGR